MNLQCPGCHRWVKFSLVFVYDLRRVYADLRGCRREVLQCARCGHRVQYAVT